MSVAQPRSFSYGEKLSLHRTWSLGKLGCKRLIETGD